MARAIPSPIDLTSRVPLEGGSASSGINLSSLSGVSSAIARSASNLGEGFSKLSGGVADLALDKDRYEYATAHADLMKSSIDLDTKYLNDTDYQTRAQRYGADFDKAAQTAAASISNSGMRQRFLSSASEIAARQNYSQSVIAKKMGDSDAVAKLKEEGDWLTNSTIGHPDDAVRGKALDAYNSRVDALVAGKVLSPVQGFQEKRNFVKQYQTARFLWLKDQLANSTDPDAQAKLDALREELRNPPPLPTPQIEAPNYSPGQVSQFRGTANAAKPGPLWGDPRDPEFASKNLTQITTNGGHSVTVNKVAADAFQGFLNELEQRGYKINDIGGYSKRLIAGTNTISQHAFGNAIDINPNENPVAFGVTKTNLPSDISDIAAKWGLTWGGDWKSKKDPMHFEFTGAQPDGQKPTQVAQNDTGTASDVSPPTAASYLDPVTREHIIQQIDQAKQSQLINIQRQHTIAKQAAQDKSDQVEGELLKNIFGNDPNLKPNDIVNNGDLTREARERMLHVLSTATKPEAPAVTSHNTTMTILDSMRRPDGDPTKITTLDPIYKAYIDGNLTRTDFTFLRDEFQKRMTPDGENFEKRKAAFIEAIKPQIDKSNPLMGKIDQSGREALYRFNFDLEKKIAEYRKSGKDPYDLLDPSKPDYLARPGALKDYQKSLTESLQDQAARLTGKPIATKIEPRKPDESPAEYLKRVGK